MICFSESKNNPRFSQWLLYNPIAKIIYNFETISELYLIITKIYLQNIFVCTYFTSFYWKSLASSAHNYCGRGDILGSQEGSRLRRLHSIAIFKYRVAYWTTFQKLVWTLCPPRIDYRAESIMSNTRCSFKHCTKEYEAETFNLTKISKLRIISLRKYDCL